VKLNYSHAPKQIHEKPNVKLAPLSWNDGTGGGEVVPGVARNSTGCYLLPVELRFYIAMQCICALPEDVDVQNSAKMA